MGAAEEIASFADLLSQKLITQEEFDSAKTRILSGMSSTEKAEPPSVQPPGQLVGRPVAPAGTAGLECPHCHSKGTVSTEQVRKKRGISGGKATAAVFTGGVSLIATGLSRKEKATQLHCGACGITWTI